MLASDSLSTTAIRSLDLDGPCLFGWIVDARLNDSRKHDIEMEVLGVLFQMNRHLILVEQMGTLQFFSVR
jgi:hypothetical protein